MTHFAFPESLSPSIRDQETLDIVADLRESALSDRAELAREGFSEAGRRNVADT
jgi:hypothetical protein